MVSSSPTPADATSTTRARYARARADHPARKSRSTRTQSKKAHVDGERIRCGDRMKTAAYLAGLQATPGQELRRLGARLGIRASSLYKHLPSKAALEAAIITVGFEEAAAAFEAATGNGTGAACHLRQRLPCVRARASPPVPAHDRAAAAPRPSP